MCGILIRLLEETEKYKNRGRKKSRKAETMLKGDTDGEREKRRKREK